MERGVAPGDRVGLVAENSVDWLIADMAILPAGAINVPPHAPLTARQIQFQLADAEIDFLFVSNRVQLDKVLQIRADFRRCAAWSSSRTRHKGRRKCCRGRLSGSAVEGHSGT